MRFYKFRILPFLSALFILSPIFFYWLMSDYDRYIWIINGPFPFNQLGGVLVQLLFLGLVPIIIGIILLIVFFIKIRSGISHKK